MTDLPAMEPCRRKSKLHDLSAIIPEGSDGDMTLFCDRCGAVRRLPVSGDLPGSLDDRSADDILRAVGR